MNSKHEITASIVTREIFEQVANDTGTDKCSSHGYHRFYPLALSQLNRGEAFTIIEIGYGSGASIPMWRTLFPNAYVICVDRDISEEGEGYVVAKANQDDPESIVAAVGNPKLPVQLIIDDGSHHPQHQLTSFSMLFETTLEPGGQYIIEDIETSYWLSGSLYGNEMRYGLFCRWSAIEALKLAADYVNRKYLSTKDKNMLEYSMVITGLSPSAAEEISTVTFGQNCALLRKAEPHDKTYNDRPYGYAAFTQRD
jgi:hypothetical protein